MTCRGAWVPRLVLLVALAAGLQNTALAQEVARIPIIDAPPQTPVLGGGIRLNSNPYVGQTDVAIFTLTEGGPMFEAAAAGVKYSYKPRASE